MLNRSAVAVLRRIVLLAAALLPTFVGAQGASVARGSVVANQSPGAVDLIIEKQLELTGQTERTPGRVALSPDGNWLAWSLSSADGTVLHVSAAADPKHDITVGPPVVTGDVCASDAPVWSPDGKTLAFTGVCQHEGAVSQKRPQPEIFLWSRKTGEVRQLTHLTGGISNTAWSFDSKSLAFLFIENATREPGYLDAAKRLAGVVGEEDIEVSRIYRVNVATGQGGFVTPPTLHVYEFTPAPNSQEFVFLGTPPPGEESWSLAKLFVVDAPVGSAGPGPMASRVLVDPQRIVGPLHGMQIAIPRWSPNGKRIAFLCGLMTDPQLYGGDICVADAHGSLSDGAPVDVTPDLDGTPRYHQWITNDTVNFVEDRSGHTMLVDWNVDTRQPADHGTLDLGEVTVEGGGPQGPAAPVVGDISYAPAHEAMAFEMQGHSIAPEIYIVSKGVSRRFTHLNEAIHTPTHTISVEWENEGLHVQGWLSFPTNYDPAKTYPLLVQPHGGPAWNTGSRWQSTPWRGINSFWPGLGYFVFFPNPRGSFGQGEAFVQGNRKDLGYGDLRDILKGLDTIQAKYPIDKAREGLLGWSYGGYMTMFGITQTHRFHAAVAGAGVSNWTSFFGENSFTSFTIPLFGASPYDDPASYARSSPITFVKQATTPTLIVAGERDDGCPPAQSLEFWRGLRLQGTPTRLVVYADEGHHFNSQDANDTLRRAAEWFAQYMPPSRGAHEEANESRGKHGSCDEHTLVQQGSLPLD
jgi:dipeptidyl aminopeptidase/acylaminoacyl peptidase